MSRKKKGSALRSKKFPKKQGVISVHPKGFGFVRMAEGPDVFIPKHAMKNAVDGDLVEVAVNPVVPIKGPEGEVVSIVERNRSTIAAIILGMSGEHYTAYSPLLGEEKLLVVRSKESLQEGDRILCKVEEWDNRLGVITGDLQEKLGHIFDPSIDVQAALFEFELPREFSAQSIAEAKKFGKSVPALELTKRRDFRDWECVTIDPTTAKDFDDAISLTQDEEGNFFLGVHIADVAFYVHPGMHLDQEAKKRCNSTYFPGFCTPMLPEALSNELCSLKPKVARLTQSVLASFDKEGTLLSWEVVRSVIKSQKRFTYEEAFLVLQGKKKSPHSPLLHRMVALCHALKKKRMERGSIDFSLPDDVIIVDEKGEPLRIERVEYDITHQMIEEFMLKANEIVARHLEKKGKSLIYRVHEEPSQESFQDFFSFARSLGFSLPVQPHNTHIQKLFQEAKSSPSLPQLSISFIRSMKLAAYSSDNIGHYGLALEHYCHFTSPIRRYTDLIIQRLLFDEIEPSANLQEIAAACSAKERVSFKAESSVKTLKKLRLAAKSFGEDPTKVYMATVTKIRPFLLYFEVEQFDLDASFHVSQMGGDYYEYLPKTQVLSGSRTGKTWKVGDTFLVRLHGVDLVRQQASWAMVEEYSRPKKKKRRAQ